MSHTQAYDPALPEVCFIAIGAALPDQRVRALRRGESGHFATTYSASSYADAVRIANHMNQKLGVSPEALECMHVGSMFGWDAPGAQLSQVLAKQEVQHG